MENKPATRHKRSIHSYWHQQDQNYYYNESSATSSIEKTFPQRKQDQSFNRLYNKQEALAEVEINKYPWEVLIYNRIDNEGRLNHAKPCPGPNQIRTLADLLMDQNGVPQYWGGVTYDTCTGSLISSRHVLTSAECVAQNRRQKYRLQHYTIVKDTIDEQDHSRQDNSKIDAYYSKPNCIFILMGYTSKDYASSKKLFKIKTVTPHPQAFSKGYNYNLGNSYDRVAVEDHSVCKSAFF